MDPRVLQVLLVLLACLGLARAQDYPVRPVKIVVPYAAGGAPDVVARVIAQRLSEALSQQFVVENRPGAGGIGAVVAVAKSAPDGYTLLVADVAQTAINPHLFADLPYDTLRDLVPVTNIANSPLFVAVGASVSIASLGELIAYARGNPGRLSYGSAGIGSIHHIAMESLKAAAGIDIVHVPYKGSGQSVPAFLTGEVQVVVSALPALGPHVKSGRAKLLAATSPARSAQAPDVPAVSESFAGYDFVAEIGLLAPAGTPARAVSTLSREATKAAAHPESAARFVALGMEPAASGTPEAYAERIRRNLDRFASAVKVSGAKPN